MPIQPGQSLTSPSFEDLEALEKKQAVALGLLAELKSQGLDIPPGVVEASAVVPLDRAGSQYSERGDHGGFDDPPLPPDAAEQWSVVSVVSDKVDRDRSGRPAGEQAQAPLPAQLPSSLSPLEEERHSESDSDDGFIQPERTALPPESRRPIVQTGFHPPRAAHASPSAEQPSVGPPIQLD